MKLSQRFREHAERHGIAEWSGAIAECLAYLMTEYPNASQRHWYATLDLIAAYAARWQAQRCD